MNSIKKKRDRKDETTPLPHTGVDFSQNQEEEFANPNIVAAPLLVPGHVSGHHERSEDYHVTRGGFS